jgi:GT2 family glycosyltransferase
VTQVFAVMLNWNQEADTRECLESLRRCGSAIRVILVDNGSRDGSPARLAADFPEVEMLCQPKNLGFAEGNNVGLRRALDLGAERILLLNNDTLVDRGFLEPLADALDRRPRVGIAGSKIYCYPDAQTLWAAGATIDWERGRQFHIGAGELDHGQYDVERDVDYVSACCLLARRDVFERAGLLDPRYFIYFEETAWSARARACGFGIRYVPASRIWHKVSAAMKTDSPNTAYYVTRNRLLFLTEHGPAERRRFYRYFFTTRPLRYGASLVLRGRGEHGRAVLQALWDFYTGRFGERRTSVR